MLGGVFLSATGTRRPSGARSENAARLGTISQNRSMRIRFVFALLLITPSLAPAQDDTLKLDDLIQNGAQWVQENIDLDLLRALADVDQPKAQQLFADLQQRFQSEYVAEDEARLPGRGG